MSRDTGVRAAVLTSVLSGLLALVPMLGTEQAKPPASRNPGLPSANAVKQGKVEFDLSGVGEGVRFVATADCRSLQDDEQGYVEFGRPTLVTPDGERLADAVEPHSVPGKVVYDYGTWGEAYYQNTSSVHQMFVLNERPSGATQISIPFETPGRAVDLGTAICFEVSSDRSFHYGQAFALDSAGMIRDLDVQLSEGTLRIQIPEDVIAKAVFPLMIDPIVGTTPTGVSGSGNTWRHRPLDIIWDPGTGTDPVNPFYVIAWNENMGVNAVQNHLTQGEITMRVVRVNLGIPTVNDQIEVGPQFSVPVGDPALGIMFSPALAFNPYAAPANGRFMMVWSETDGSSFGFTNVNGNLIIETDIYNDTFGFNTAIFGRRFNVDPVTGVITPVGAAVNISGTVLGEPCIYPDVTHDAASYLVVWQRTYGLLRNFIEVVGGQEFLHYWWTKNRAEARQLDETGAFLAPTYSIIGAEKFRPFVSSGTSGGPVGTIIASDLPKDYEGFANYEFVPVDMVPRTTSLIWPGPDGVMYTPDDGTGLPANQEFSGSMVVWSLSSLVFNVPKSRIRARWIPIGSGPNDLNTIVFDVFNSTGTFVVRPTVTSVLSKQADDATTATINETLATSFYAIAWQTVDEVAWEGSVRAVELFGSINMRLAEEYGYPSGGEIPVAVLDGSNKYLTPNVAGSFETEQVHVGYTRTDGLLFNPTTLTRAFFPKGFIYLDSTSTMAPLATLYPESVSQSFNVGVVNPATSDLANHHVMVFGAENDFGANYVRRYKYAATPAIGNPKIYTVTGEGSATGPNPDSDPVAPHLRLNFTTPNPTTIPAAQTFQIGNVGLPLSKLNWTVDSNDLYVLVNGGSTASGGPLGPGEASNVTVTVNPTFLTDGTYVTQLTISGPLATNSPIVVEVSLTIGTGVPPGTSGLTSSSTAIALTAPIGGPNPPPGSFSITFIETAPGQLADYTLALTSITPAGSAWIEKILPLPIGFPYNTADQTTGTSLTYSYQIDMTDPPLVAAGAGVYTATLSLTSPGSAGAGSGLGNNADDTVVVNTPTITITLTATGLALVELCTNSTDDDGDGDVDCLDADCATDPACAGPPPPGGGGTPAPSAGGPTSASSSTRGSGGGASGWLPCSAAPSIVGLDATALWVLAAAVMAVGALRRRA